MDEYICEVVTEHELCGDVHHYVRRERVVRCRDCVYAGPCPLADSEKLMCAFHDEMLVTPDGFCAWGEPRERDADDQD